VVWAIAKGWVGLRYEPGRNMQTTPAQLLDGLYGGKRVNSGITKKTMTGIIGKCLGFADEYATKHGLLKGCGKIGRLGLDGCKAVPLLAASVQVGYRSEGSIFDDYDPDEPVDDDRVVVDAGQELPAEGNMFDFLIGRV